MRTILFQKHSIGPGTSLAIFPRWWRALAPIAVAVAVVIGAHAQPVKSHPRLLFRAEDLPGLRARMTTNNDVWLAFKQSVVDSCYRDWLCSSTQVYDTTNLVWVRTSFTDENGVLHLPGDTGRVAIAMPPLNG